MDTLLDKALAPNTKKAYDRSMKKFLDFCQKFNIKEKFPFSSDIILQYISFLNLQKVPSQSIMPMLSAISYKHKINDLPDPCKSFKVAQILNALKKDANPVKQKLPITLTLLNKIVSAIYKLGLSNYEALLFRTMFLMQFFFALRIGEFTESRHNLSVEEISLKDDSITINFKSYKHSTDMIDSPHIVHKSKEGPCPVEALKNYISLRGKNPGPLFIIHNKSIKRSNYNRIFKLLLKSLGENESQYSSHSFRAGATTYWSNKGLSELQIKRLGRWKSNAIFKYLRGPIVHTM